VYDFQVLTVSATLSCLRLCFRVPHTFLSSGRSAGRFFSYLCDLVAWRNWRLLEMIRITVVMCAEYLMAVDGAFFVVMFVDNISSVWLLLGYFCGINVFSPQ